MGSGFFVDFVRLFKQLDGVPRHDGGDRMLVDKLRMTVTTEKNTEVVEPGDDTLQLDAIHEEYRQRNLALANVVEKGVLKVLRAIARHGVCLVTPAADLSLRVVLNVVRSDGCLSAFASPVVGALLHGEARGEAREECIRKVCVPQSIYVF